MSQILTNSKIREVRSLELRVQIEIAAKPSLCQWYLRETIEILNMNVL